jgi:hypothetical protein
VTRPSGAFPVLSCCVPLCLPVFSGRFPLGDQSAGDLCLGGAGPEPSAWGCAFLPGHQRPELIWPEHADDASAEGEGGQAQLHFGPLQPSS